MDPLNEERISVPHVVAMPYPGRGHINPMMNLCVLLASRNDDVLFTFVVTEEWLGLLGSESKKPPSNVRFCSIPNVVPSERGRAADIAGFVEAVMTKMEAPLERVLDGLEPPPTTIMTDAFMLWAVKVGNRRCIPVASLWTMSATVFSILHHFHLLVQNNHYPLDLSERGDEPVEYIPGISSIRIADLPSMLPGNYNQALQLIHQVFSCSQPQYLIFTSIYRLESHVIDALRNSNLPFPIHTIGPAIPYFKLQNDSVSTPRGPNYLQWLDAQPTRSVLYVSMGTLIPLSSAQAEELVAGLRDASIRYLWVARAETFQERGDGGREERLGLVVPWCDQLRVLCHPSVGGFWTHCGWNSTVEGAFAGVPMLTFPMIADQITNSKLVVEDWKIGWRVRGERIGGGDLVVRRDEIARLVGRFMNLEEEEMIEMRERAREVREICQGAIAEGGSSDIHLRAVVEKISNP